MWRTLKKHRATIAKNKAVETNPSHQTCRHFAAPDAADALDAAHSVDCAGKGASEIGHWAIGLFVAMVSAIGGERKGADSGLLGQVPTKIHKIGWLSLSFSLCGVLLSNFVGLILSANTVVSLIGVFCFVVSLLLLGTGAWLGIVSWNAWPGRIGVAIPLFLFLVKVVWSFLVLCFYEVLYTVHP